MKTPASHQMRLFPALVAVLGLLVFLKLSGLAIDGGFTLEAISTATAQDAQGAGDAPSQDAPENAEAANEEPPLEVNTTTNANEPQPRLDGTVAEGRRIRLNRPTKEVSSAELALLESLRKRRVELDARANALEMRENLLKAAEKRIDEKLEALKVFDARIEEQFKKQESAENEQFAGLVSMYENMKPKDAARILSRLETDVLVSVATRMKPRKLAPVLSKMDSASAERLTVEMAQAASPSDAPPGELAPVASN